MNNSTLKKIKDYKVVTIILITLNLYDEKYIITNFKKYTSKIIKKSSRISIFRKNIDYYGLYVYPKYKNIKTYNKNPISIKEFIEQKPLKIQNDNSEIIHNKRRLNQKLLFESKKQNRNSHMKHNFVLQRYQIRRNQY